MSCREERVGEKEKKSASSYETHYCHRHTERAR